MAPIAGSVRDGAAEFVTADRQIGPIGTVARVALGAIAIALPVALEGISWWDVGAVLVAFPLIATAADALITTAYQRFAPGSLARRHAIWSTAACALGAVLIATAIALTVLTPVGPYAIWIWVGVSLLLAGARGYGGCELLAFPNTITGRRDQIGCIVLTPIDTAEARHGTGRA